MIVILEGESGSGKTTVATALAERARAAGRRVSGVICPGRFEAGRKLGISAVDVESGDSWLLAQAVMDIGEQGQAGKPRFDDSRQGFIRYGRWEFIATGLARADAAASRPATGRRELVIVDEIGPLELNHGRGLMKTLAAMDEAEAGRGADYLVVARPDIAEVLATRWPSASRVVLTGMAGTGAEQAAAEAERALRIGR